MSVTNPNPKKVSPYFSGRYYQAMADFGIKFFYTKTCKRRWKSLEQTVQTTESPNPSYRDDHPGGSQHHRTLLHATHEGLLLDHLFPWPETRGSSSSASRRHRLPADDGSRPPREGCQGMSGIKTPHASSDQFSTTSFRARRTLLSCGSSRPKKAVRKSAESRDWRHGQPATKDRQSDKSPIEMYRES